MGLSISTARQLEKNSNDWKVSNLRFSKATSIALDCWSTNDGTSVGQTTLVEQGQIVIIKGTCVSLYIDNWISMEPFGSEQFSNVLAFASLPVPNGNNCELVAVWWGQWNVAGSGHVSPIVTTGCIWESYLATRCQLKWKEQQNLRLGRFIEHLLIITHFSPSGHWPRWQWTLSSTSAAIGL